MALNPKLTKDPQGVWWLEHDRCPNCSGYAYTTPGGTSRTFDPGHTRVKVGKKPEPFTVTVAPLSVSQGAVESVTQPPSTPLPWVVEPPRVPFTTITNAPDLGLNVYLKREDVHDVVINKTGETGVLFQGAINNWKADGSTIRRVKMTLVAAGNSVGYGMHGIYGKATGLVGEDIDMTLSKYCADGLSARFPSEWRRFKIRGEHVHAITYFESSKVVGDVLFEDFDATFNHTGTAIWVAPETQYQTQVIAHLIFKGVAMVGPASALFLNADEDVFKGSVRAEGCTLNGKPVAKANFHGVTDLTIV